MRHGMFLLAVSGILAGQPVAAAAADNPFDFSNPLPTAGQRRTAQYFSRTPEAAATGEGIRIDAEPEQSPYRRSARPPQSGHPLDADGTPPSVDFGSQTAPEQQAARQADPDEALRRFDEFLKTRAVVAAGYAEPSGQEASSPIRPVQMETGDMVDDLPFLGDLDGEVPSEFSGNSPAPQRFPANDAATAAPMTATPMTATPMTATPFAQPPASRSEETRPSATPAPVRPTPGVLFGQQPRSQSGERLMLPISTEPAAEAAAVDTHSQRAAGRVEFGRSPGRLQQMQLPEQTLEVQHFGTLNAPSSPAATPHVQHALAVTGSLEPPAIETTWKFLDPLNVGHECRAELTLANLGEADADRVSIEVRLPPSVQLVKAEPPPVEERTLLGWKLAGLAGGERQTIRLVLVADVAGPLDLSAHVRHTSSRNESFTVAEPKLELALSGPAQVRVGEPASQTLVVTNPGTGVATNVRIEAMIPAGLEHATGEHLEMDIGSLNPGETRSVRLVMGAVGGGDHVIQVRANADSGLVQTAAAEVKVVAPSLRASIAGPSLRYLGREAEYTLRVLNDGSAATDLVQVNQHIPEAFDFVNAGRGANFDRNSRILNWFVGRVESGESLDMKVTLVPRRAGEYVHEIRATSELGAQADARVTTRVEGAASLVVKVSDLDDPVEVGAQTAYEITITNEGTASASMVALACEIPQGLRFLKAQGPSDHRMQEGILGFRPLDELPAGKSLTYRVHVSGDVAGDQRFRCRLSSESLTQPLITEELTKFYGE